MGQEQCASSSIRVWTSLDLELLRKHLILIDDLYGMCASCKQVGLNYIKDQQCPACGADFKYVATRLTRPGEIAKILNRIKYEKLTLTLVDREDYDRANAHNAAGNLFT
jgi:hypothetical protein